MPSLCAAPFLLAPGHSHTAASGQTFPNTRAERKTQLKCAQIKYTLTFTHRPVIAQCFDAQYVLTHSTQAICIINTHPSICSYDPNLPPLSHAFSIGKICSPDLILFHSLHFFHVALVLCVCLFPSGLFIAPCYYFLFVFE